MKAACSTFVLLTALTGRTAADELNSTLDELRAALRFQLSSLHSIFTKYTISYQPDGTIKDRRPWGPDAHEWAEQQELKLLISFSPERLPKPPNVLHSFDGVLAYDYSWSTDPAEHGRLKISKTMNRGYSSAITPNRLIGRNIIVVDCSVLDIVDNHAAVLAGREEIGGVECYRIDLENVDTGTSVVANVSVFLDPRHDYLPKRISVDRTIKGTNYQMAYDVEEFGRVRDNEAHNDRWFPTLGTFHQVGGRHSLAISEVTINDTIPIERFRPNVPDGTQVYDWTTGDQRIYISGGRQAVDAITKKRAAEAKQELAGKKKELEQQRDEGMAMFDASADQGWPFARMLLYTSAAAIAIGAIVFATRTFRAVHSR